MERTITINNETIHYRIRKNKRAKYVRATVYGNGEVVVTQPRGVSERAVAQFLREKHAWLVRKVQASAPAPDSPFARCDKAHFDAHKHTASRMIHEKVHYWNRYYGFSFAKIFIRRQRTRWGSCSSKQNLSFNYKIMFLPEVLQDYIVVHELCHLHEMNHSPRFWELMQRTIPDAKARSRQLRHHKTTLSG